MADRYTDRREPEVLHEFYQPLSLASRYFVAPQFDFEERSVFELRNNNDRVAEYRVREVEAGSTSAARSPTGERSASACTGVPAARLLIGDPSLPATEFERGGYFTRFSYDKLDSIFFRVMASSSMSSGARSVRVSAPIATSTSCARAG
jgi:NTE family protein